MAELQTNKGKSCSYLNQVHLGVMIIRMDGQGKIMEKRICYSEMYLSLQLCSGHSNS